MAAERDDVIFPPRYFPAPNSPEPSRTIPTTTQDAQLTLGYNWQLSGGSALLSGEDEGGDGLTLPSPNLGGGGGLKFSKV
jgi:hypothetical protein